MKIISEASESILKILARFKKKSERYRVSHYVVEERVAEGVLLFNLLTRELVLLTEEEYARSENVEYLKERWFLVPLETKEKEYADLVKWVLSTRQKKPRHITGYTIFTTTDCNARCFYCFELGRSRIPMGPETARKTAKYIYDHCGGERVSISWFGGEPLYNQEAMNIICSELRAMGVKYRSFAVSNGYLFDQEAVDRAVSDWNLKRVQITLDGTRKVYNKIKAYIYKDTDPYQVVMENIGRLLDAGIMVQIRLNMDMYNADDLLALVEELAERFPGKKNLFVYANHLFEKDVPMAHSHTQEEWEVRGAAMERLNASIRHHGMHSRQGVSKQIRMNQCMADSGNSVTIAPNGEIGLCEHYGEDEFIGHIDRETFDEEIVRSWKQKIDEIPECAECFYYPQCIRLRKCSNSSVCYEQERKERLARTRQAMVNSLDNCYSTETEEEADEEFC